jgi:hypothetical protein
MATGHCWSALGFGFLVCFAMWGVIPPVTDASLLLIVDCGHTVCCTLSLYACACHEPCTVISSAFIGADFHALLLC